MPKDSPVNGDVWVDSWSHLFGDAMESSPTKKDEKGHVLVCNAMLGVTRAYEDSFQKVLPGRWNKVVGDTLSIDECLGNHVFLAEKLLDGEWRNHHGMTWAEEVCQEQSLRTVKTILPESHGIDAWLLRGGFIQWVGVELPGWFVLVWSDHSLGGWLSSRKMAKILKASYKDIWRTSNQ